VVIISILSNYRNDDKRGISVSGKNGNKRRPLSLKGSKVEPMRLSGLRLFPFIPLTLTKEKSLGDSGSITLTGGQFLYSDIIHMVNE
jgi:hypothetical protein